MRDTKIAIDQFFFSIRSDDIFFSVVFITLALVKKGGKSNNCFSKLQRIF